MILQWFIILDMKNLVNIYHHYWMLLKLSSWNQNEQQNGGLIFKLGRYNRVFLKIWAQIPIWTPILKQWAVQSFFLWKYSEELTATHKSSFFFFTKTSKWQKCWSLWLRMTNAFILCNLLWKVQKRLAGNREGSFNGMINWDYIALTVIICYYDD